MLSYTAAFLALLVNNQVPLYAGVFFQDALETHGFRSTSPCDGQYQVYSGPEGCMAGLLVTEPMSLLVFRCPHTPERTWVVDHDTCSTNGLVVECHMLLKDVFKELASF